MLTSDPVMEALAADDVASMVADISSNTSIDKEFLVELGHGIDIPLLFVFPVNSDEPYVLQGLYSRSDLLGAIEQARADGEAASTTAVVVE